jgi:hypothetical protein
MNASGLYISIVGSQLFVLILIYDQKKHVDASAHEVHFDASQKKKGI